MGNNKADITGSKIQKLGRKTRTDKCSILLGENRVSMEELAKRFSYVYSFYRRACLNGIWDKIQKALVKKVRLAKGKKETPGYALIDSQSAKTVSSNEKR